MSTPKEKIAFTEEQETLLVPLYAKATESRRPSPIFADAKAQEILERVDYDFSRLRVPRKTSITLCIRATRLDAYTRDFLAANPAGLVLHLGCGLDSRCRRVTQPRGAWYDLDLPAVIDLRRKFYAEDATYHMIASSVTDLRWAEQVAAGGRPALVVAEGLLMYLRDEDVKALMLRLREAFPGCRLACDAFSRLTAQRVGAHPSIKKTGASVHWGIDDAREIEQWAAGIHLREEWYFAQAPEIARLDAGYRLMFRLAGRFAVANKAQRILYYDL